MILVKAPFRLSLFGGGTDRPEFLRQHDWGICISCSINKYTYVSVKALPEFFPYKSKITYSEIEKVSHNSEIHHNIIRECIRFAGLEYEGLEINHISDLPSGVGLGTSSSITVALLEALHLYKYGYTYLTSELLWQDSFHVEKNLVSSNIGWQDFWPAVYGYGHVYKFHLENDHVNKVDRKILPDKFLNLINKYGLLYYLGETHNSTEVVNEYTSQLSSDYQLGIRTIAKEAEKEIFYECDAERLGYLMTSAWRLKKRLGENVATRKMLFIEGDIQPLSLGYRVCGAGAGGCMFVLANPDRHATIHMRMIENGCIHIPFQVNGQGVRQVL